MSAMLEIEKRRIELGIPVSDLERAAGTAQRYYSKCMNGDRTPRPGLIARFRLALSRLKVQRETDTSLELMVCYRMAVAMAAGALGPFFYERYLFAPPPKPLPRRQIELAHAMQRMADDALEVHAQPPGRRATQDPEWMAAAEVRRLAVYLMNAGAGFRQTETGHAAGMTKQAVSLAVRDIEDMREDPDFDRLVDRLTAQIAGDW